MIISRVTPNVLRGMPRANVLTHPVPWSDAGLIQGWAVTNAGDQLRATPCRRVFSVVADRDMIVESLDYEYHGEPRRNVRVNASAALGRGDTLTITETRTYHS